MNVDSFKTQHPNRDTVNKEWLVIDATDQPLGRLCSKVASLIRGKHKTYFSPHVDCGDRVIVINAEKVKLTGKKMTDKVYVRHTGFPGGQRTTTPREVLAKFPERLVEKAVKGMLPKNKLGSKLFKNLHVVIGAEHKHEAQQPKTIEP